MPDALLLFHWDGEAMAPHPRFAKLCDDTFVIGQTYRLTVQEHRSQSSHNHYFASIQEAWENLPEDQADRFPSSEHLRKWALIKAGYCDERTFPCASRAEALRLVGFIKPLDDYAIIDVPPDAAVVRVRTAQSQSKAAMGKETFQKSKTAVLDVLAGLIGTTRHALQSARAA